MRCDFKIELTEDKYVQFHVSVVKPRMLNFGIVIFKFLYAAKRSTLKFESAANGVKTFAGTEVNLVMLNI